MKTKSKIITTLILTSSASIAISLINKGVKLTATKRNLLIKPDALCFKWRLGNIHYTVCGTGKPLLLVHDLNAISSSFEWSNIISQLKEYYTVYTIDLLGCGCSEKPNLTYTNFLYVQLISDFIKSVIGHRTDVMATAAASSVIVMACSNSPELFDQLMLINPESLHVCGQVPGKRAKFFNFILDLPIIGTLLYNMAVSKKAISELLRNEYFNNPYSVRPQVINAYNESAHLGESPKSVYASVRCYYTKCNIVNALKKIDNSIYLIGGKEIKEIQSQLEEYKVHNPAIEIAYISNAKLLPQLEQPEEFLRLIKTYLV